MDSNVIAIIIGGVALLIFVLIARRLLRLALKMTLVGVVVVALLFGAGLGWWQGWFGASPTKAPPPRRSTPARPITAH